MSDSEKQQEGETEREETRVRLRKRKDDQRATAGTSKGKKQKKSVGKSLQPSHCSVCHHTLTDALSCGHWVCRECITSLKTQSGSTGDFLCPFCDFPDVKSQRLTVESWPQR